MLTEEGIALLANKTLAVAGCGGVGGAQAILMARMGVGRFRLADPGIFDEPDSNRQWGGFISNLGRKKVDVYQEQLLDINPEIDVTLFSDGITQDNPDTFLEGADVLIDCLDVTVPMELRERLHHSARQRGIYILTAPVLGFGCVVAASLPDGPSMELFTSLFRNSHSNDELPEALSQIFMPEHLSLVGKALNIGRIPSVAIGPSIAASLTATESLLFMLENVIPGSRRPLSLPNMLLFDLFRMSYQSINVSMLGSPEANS